MSSGFEQSLRKSTTPATFDREIRQIVLPGQTPAGEHVLSVLHKRTYDVVPNAPCLRATMDAKLHSGDVHYGDPMNSTVKFESDLVPFKVATDVVLNGTVYAPRGRAAHELSATLEVGAHTREVHVIGDRRALFVDGGDPVFTDPEPFTTMELRYERAYGGVDIYSDPKVPCGYARNHLGRGFAVTNTRRAIDNLPLPNLEDPANRLTPNGMTIGHFMHWERQPMPVGFGWFLKYWQPRAALAGVMPADRKSEQQLRKAYGALVPKEQRAMWEQTELPDMDFRFFNGASLGLALPFLEGDEAVHAINLTSDCDLTFKLPGDRPRIGLDIGFGVQDPQVVLHTVMIRLDERQVDLVWRGAVPYDGPDWIPQMKKMEVHIT